MYSGYNNQAAAEAGAYGGENAFGDFTSKAVRQGFIRKVYGILSVQLIITFGFVAALCLSEDTRKWTRQNTWLFWLAIGVVFVTIIMLSCCGDFARKTPHNYICLLLFTLGESFLVGVSASLYNWRIVLYAVAITAVIVIALTMFAFQTKIDFTVYSGLLFVLMFVFMIFGFVAIFWRGPIIHLVYSCCGALLFSAFLVVDTQMIVGGNREMQLSPEDYVYGALMLYLDIIQLFLHLLRIISAFSNN